MARKSPTGARESVSEGLTLRRLTSDDAEQYNRLRLHAFQSNPKSFARSYEEEVKVPLDEVAKRLDSGVYFGVFDGDKLVGSVSLCKEELDKMSHKADAREMYVDDRERGKGIGKKLLTALFEEAEQQGVQELQLAVWAENAPAVKLYKSMGFVVWGTEKNALRLADGTTLDEFHMSRRMGEDKSSSSELGDEVNVVGEKLKGVTAGTESGLRKRELDAFGERENYFESQMLDAIVCVEEMTSESPRFAEVWKEKWDWACVHDRYEGPRTGYVDRMLTETTNYLKSLLNGSTFSYMGTRSHAQMYLEEAARGGSRAYLLGDFARHVREALDVKIFQLAARHIAAERNKRLAQAFGLQSVHEIIPAHRFQYPSYDFVTPEQMAAYIKGDRTEFVFGIGEWKHSALANGHVPVFKRGEQRA